MKAEDLKVGMCVVVTNASSMNSALFRNGAELICTRVDLGQWDDGAHFSRIDGKGDKDYQMWAREIEPIASHNHVTMNNTPATRMGLQVGDYVKVIGDSYIGEIVKLSEDDSSGIPIFTRGNGQRIFKDLKNVRKATVAEILENSRRVSIPAQTPCEQAGITKDKFYKVVRVGFSKIKSGDIIQLHHDDGTSAPYWKRVTDGEVGYAPVDGVVEITPTPAEKAGLKVGDYVRGVVSGSYMKIISDCGGDAVETTRLHDGIVHWNLISYLTKVSKEEALASIQTPAERAGFKVGDKIVYEGEVYTFTHDDKTTVPYFRDEGGHETYLSLQTIAKFDGNYLKLRNIKVGDIVRIENGASTFIGGSIGVVLTLNNTQALIGGDGTSYSCGRNNCKGAYVSAKYVRKATKEEVREYLQRQSGNVSSDLVKFALS